MQHIEITFKVKLSHCQIERLIYYFRKYENLMYHKNFFFLQLSEFYKGISKTIFNQRKKILVKIYLIPLREMINYLEHHEKNDIEFILFSINNLFLLYGRK